jgi:hypothetical protein
MNLYQAFNQNPVNFVDPFGTIIKTEDLYELKRINESQGTDAAKRWIDRNPNFTSGEKLDLHMKVWVGWDDPDEFSVLDEWFDKTTYQLYGWFWAKLQRGVLNEKYMGGLNDAAAGGINFLQKLFYAFMKLINPDYAYEEDLNRAEKKGVSGVNEFFKADPETAMYATGEFYTPVIVGSVIGGELSAGMQSQFTDDILGLGKPGTKLISPELSGENVRLYRAISDAEYQQIIKTGKFETGPSSMGGKFFAERASDAAKWGDYFYGPGGNYRIIEIELRGSVANNFMRWERLDGIGPARYAELEQLFDYIIRLVR